MKQEVIMPVRSRRTAGSTLRNFSGGTTSSGILEAGVLIFRVKTLAEHPEISKNFSKLSKQ
jgi:hypothetical protein